MNKHMDKLIPILVLVVNKEGAPTLIPTPGERLNL